MWNCKVVEFDFEKEGERIYIQNKRNCRHSELEGKKTRFSLHERCYSKSAYFKT
jgi:hypothetical protein